MAKRPNEGELLAAWRALAWNNEQQAARLLEVCRVLARDVLMLTDMPPTDSLWPTVVNGARYRAREVLANIGAEEASKAH